MNERRAFARFPYDCPVAVRRATDPRMPIEAQGVDLSIGGLSLEFPYPLIPGEFLKVSFALDSEQEITVLEVIESGPVDGAALVRGAFFRPTEDLVTLLSRWTARQRRGTTAGGV